MQEYVVSWKSGRRACSQYIGELIASVTVPGEVEMATVTVPTEQFVPRCFEHAVASECCCLGHHAAQHCNSPAETV